MKNNTGALIAAAMAGMNVLSFTPSDNLGVDLPSKDKRGSPETQVAAIAKALAKRQRKMKRHVKH